MCKFKKKSIEDKFFLSKIWLGGHPPQGAPKSEKVLRWIDRGSRDLFNGVKILALRSAKLKINGVKLLLSKNTEIFKFNFLEIWSSDFSKIFRECRGVDSLSTHEFVGTCHLRKKVTESSKKKFEIYFGGSRSQGYQNFTKGYGYSIEDLEPRRKV